MDQKWNKNKTMAKRIVEQFLNGPNRAKVIALFLKSGDEIGP